jgi:hypothetical protein
VPITTKVVSLNPVRGKVYSIQYYVLGGLGGGTNQSGAAGVIYLATDINSLPKDRKVSFFANISLPISFHH